MSGEARLIDKLRAEAKAHGIGKERDAKVEVDRANLAELKDSDVMDLARTKYLTTPKAKDVLARKEREERQANPKAEAPPKAKTPEDEMEGIIAAFKGLDEDQLQRVMNGVISVQTDLELAGLEATALPDEEEPSDEQWDDFYNTVEGDEEEAEEL